MMKKRWWLIAGAALLLLGMGCERPVTAPEDRSQQAPTPQRQTAELLAYAEAHGNGQRVPVEAVERDAAVPPPLPETPAVAPAEERPADLALGEKIYGRTCQPCHGTGIAGAPRVGDPAAWQPHLAKGMEIMVRHAIEGYRGDKGVMPPRGGNASLTDQEVAAAVAYMAAQSQ